MSPRGLLNPARSRSQHPLGSTLGGEVAQASLAPHVDAGLAGERWARTQGSRPRGPRITTARPTLSLAWCPCAAGFQLCVSAWVLAAWGCWALASLSPSRVASWVLLEKGATS